MTWEQRVREQIAHDEGLRLFPYQDTTGHLSIGHGRNLDTVGITTTEAEVMLSHDIEAALTALDRDLPWWRTLDDARRAVLLNMRFNLGNRLRSFRRMLTALEARDFQAAAIQMLASKWATQVPARATQLTRMMQTGHWPE